MAQLEPFPVRTTENIELANRFLAFRDSPAFHDVFRLSQALVEEARANQRRFKGWDSQQIVTLAIRTQVAEEFHEELFKRMAVAINDGIVEAQNQLNARQAADMSDRLRDQVLQKADSDNRIPGSY